MIHVDNAPEYFSAKLIECASKHHITLCYVQPGKPQPNEYIERYNRTVHDKGIRITVPTDFFLGNASRREVSTSLALSTRDGGTRVSVNGRIHT